MKKITKVALIGVLGVGIFAAGNLTGNANTDWATQIQTDNRHEIINTADAKTDEILNIIDTELPSLIKAKMEGTLSAEKLALVEALEAYFNTKLEGITETEKYQGLLTQMQIDAQTQLDRYKAEIDAAFNDANN